jgi:hypothetical protein
MAPDLPAPGLFALRGRFECGDGIYKYFTGKIDWKLFGEKRRASPLGQFHSRKQLYIEGVAADDTRTETP